eukprot:TRINITY_DN25045_c0_g1_i1.p1 TRINITY_DN25045_c0_g1~~TRINITY_DN25045_c0_g1_i1.p1  ORF type:complete len:372 (-),score=55.58 TRINITY_DN25045_c0_g1_i1:187-1302(-)
MLFLHVTFTSTHKLLVLICCMAVASAAAELESQSCNLMQRGTWSIAAGQVGLTESQQADNGPLPLEQSFRQVLADLVKTRGYTHSQPIVVIAVDRTYSLRSSAGKPQAFLESWTDAMSRSGLGQQVIVALDNATANVSARQGLPVLSFGGEASQTSGGSLPTHYTEAKFFMPLLLLEDGFELVLSLEADVYLFQSPLHLLDQEINLVGVQAYTFDHGTGPMPNVNLGFLAFRGSTAARLLRHFLHRWHGVTSLRKQKRLVDQNMFSAMLHDYTQTPGNNFSSRLFTQREFPLSVCGKIDVDVLAVHCARCNQGCKNAFLDNAYRPDGLTQVRHMASSDACREENVFQTLLRYFIPGMGQRKPCELPDNTTP